MAILKLYTYPDKVLSQKCEPVAEVTDEIRRFLDDMLETMYADKGVGLAAPQVGILRRACIVMETNVPEGEDEYFIELVNPEIVERDGEQEGGEGCLSLPERYGVVKRPNHVKVRAQDRNGNTFEVEGTGLTARCFCHEIDHLDGVLFTDRATHMYTGEEMEELYGGDDKE